MHRLRRGLDRQLVTVDDGEGEVTRHAEQDPLLENLA
jgi:hypothetical protein